MEIRRFNMENRDSHKHTLYLSVMISDGIEILAFPLFLKIFILEYLKI